ncbi:hypothetical protein DL96DRAFT_1617202 [Flagelloscypha sp. PMI_526]|nr:hypothetical protein DL96DRAFT_1617202 [Flagelloscypha sp. PMI_526]
MERSQEEIFARAPRAHPTMRYLQPTAEEYKKELDTLFMQAALDNLPIDLLLRIFSLCSAQTIAKLRQCCKYFCQLSHEQIVWLEVLKRTCTDLDVPFPSFPQTTRSSADIELHATAWIRFQLALGQAKDGQPLSYKIVRPVHITEHIHSFEQSIDGRFLFVLHNTRILVWSLDTNLPRVVHSCAVEIPEQSWASLSCEAETNSSVILYLFVAAFSPRLHQRAAFRFNFPSHGHDSVQLDFLSQLDCLRFSVTQWGTGTSLSNLMVTQYEHPEEGRHCLYWDAVKGTCATWVADPNDTGSEINLMIVHGFLVSFDMANQSMVIYALPELPPKDSYAPEICAKLNNPALLYIPGTPERRLASKLSWTSSFSNGSPASEYDSRAMIYYANDDGWLLEHIGLHQSDSPSEQLAPVSLKCKCYSLHGAGP